MLRLIPMFFSVLVILSGCQSGNILFDLRCENLANPIAIDTPAPRLSWKIKAVENGDKQLAYQIIVASDISLLSEEKADLWNSGKVDSPQSVLINYQGKELSSSALAYWKVRIWDKNGKESKWSETATFSVGLLKAEDWKGKYIGLQEQENKSQSPLLLKQFEVVNKNEVTFLHVNSLGYHEVYINGTKVGEDVLTPAVSQLDKRSLSNTYDITSYVKEGVNDLVIWLGQGWYREQPLYRNIAHNGPLVRAQMEVRREGIWHTILTTDNTWLASRSGYATAGSWDPWQFGGENVDAAQVPADLTEESLKSLSWQAALEVEVPEHIVSPQMSERNRISEVYKAKSITQLADSTWLIDMGISMTGWGKIALPKLNQGDQLVIEYGDHLKDGDIFRQGQIDRYTASGKEGEVFCNKFNYHGFRYIRISNLHTPPAIDGVSGHLIQTNFKQASTFACSDEDMNAIHDMIQYTLRCLSLGGYLVDCPQIERLGYGGDGNASTKTAQIMFDLDPLYANWLAAWGDCVRADGGMPHTAPNHCVAGGGPYWCGFIITASWRTYLNYGDTEMFKKYYPVMQQWLGYVESNSVDGLLKRWPDHDYRHWYLGDWANPDGVDQTNEASVDLVNNCYVSECYQTMGKIATILGKPDDAKRYAAQHSQLAALIQQKFFSTQTGTYATASQIDMVYPMLAGVTPAELRPAVTEKLLSETAQKWNGHLSTGLVGVPIITEWATKDGAADFIYSMLKKRDYPGYLYMIDNGATTTWEHWNGDRSWIHNCYNGIGSWFYEALGGIGLDENAPAYRNIIINPQIPEGITWAKTTKETPYGTLIVDWALVGNQLELKLTVPTGCTAQVVLPSGVKEYKLSGNDKLAEKGLVLIESGSYNLKWERK